MLALKLILWYPASSVLLTRFATRSPTILYTSIVTLLVCGIENSILVEGLNGFGKFCASVYSSGALTSTTTALYFLPDGNHFLYSTKNSYGGSTPGDGIYVASLDNNKPVKLISASSNCQYADGFLFFVRQSILLAQKFNPDKLKIEGEAMSVVENVQYFDAGISGTFAVSQDGKLVYIKGKETRQNLVLLDKNGKEIRKISDMIPANTAFFSPDGNKIASDLGDPNEKKTNIWVYDLNRNVSTKLTFDSSDVVSIWTPDGKQITYTSNVNSKFYNAYIKNADGSGNAELLYKSDFNKAVTSISADGKYFMYNGINYASPTSGWDIFLMPAGKDKKPETILATNSTEISASFSPNMKWIAYQSDESGKMQVYVIPESLSGKTRLLPGKPVK